MGRGRKQLHFAYLSFILWQGWAQSKTRQSNKVHSVEKHNCCLRNTKLARRKNFFCLVIAFPPTLKEAKRSLLWLQPGNGRQALGCSWLSSAFCLCWTRGDTPLIRSKVLEAICFQLQKKRQCFLTSTHAGAGCPADKPTGWPPASAWVL